MRRFPLVSLVLIGLAPPALAQPPRPARPDPAAVARALDDPLVREGAAQALAQLAGIVLDTHVGPLAALADPRDHVRATDTLADVARRDDPAFDRHLHDDAKRAVDTAGAVAGGAVAEKAELDRTAARLRAALAPLVAALAPARLPRDR